MLGNYHQLEQYESEGRCIYSVSGFVILLNKCEIPFRACLFGLKLGGGGNLFLYCWLLLLRRTIVGGMKSFSNRVINTDSKLIQNCGIVVQEGIVGVELMILHFAKSLLTYQLFLLVLLPRTECQQCKEPKTEFNY